ncbi:FF domain protein [Aspergillus saccharolyticus JOP 1030-1]|uniref:FF domain protein n=1 Tax=Aspergillus saccharolyticus JOP 1030-1 TaxID=1450539 RepID=A0A318Z9P9_9EURO|nr:FF domain protein [Aspergillus saccharolyticus JOP 1030-1]PYH44135.1 FF domain protein [Aspergillus saccharolyticus JOP 1030-1]
MLRSTYTPPPPLPPGWTEHKAPTGHTYYYNAQTKQSTYTRPLPVPAQSQPPTIAPQPPTFNASIDTLPPFSSTPYAPHGFGLHATGSNAIPQYGQQHGGHGQENFRGARNNYDRRRRGPEDRPKKKHPIPGCAPWVLVKTKLGRRFVHNPETNESFWKIPPEVMEGVFEFDRLEQEALAKKERGEDIEGFEESKQEDGSSKHRQGAEGSAPGPMLQAEADSDEYEEVEVTDSEDEDQNFKRPKIDEDGGQTQPMEFTEEDMEYQLAAMGEEYGLDPGEYGEPGDEEWEEGAEGLPLTEEDATALFRDLLNDFHINPFTTWEKIIEEGHIINDSRYTVLPNMKSRRDVWSNWSRDRIQEIKECKQKQEKKDPRIKYLSFLQEHATPKLYWPEFKRKYRKEPEMKDPQLSDKDREKFYRDLVSRMKQSESSRKSDLSALLRSVPLHELNKSSNLEALPTSIITDLRYIALAPKVRDPLIETYISTLAPAPEDNLTAEEREELERKRVEREKRERALAEREKQVQDERRKQKGELIRGKHLLREGEVELEEAMQVNKGGLRSYLEADEQASRPQEE